MDVKFQVDRSQRIAAQRIFGRTCCLQLSSTFTLVHFLSLQFCLCRSRERTNSSLCVLQTGHPVSHWTPIKGNNNNSRDKRVGVKKGQYRRDLLSSGKTKPPSKHIQPLRVTVHYKLMPLKLRELGGWTGWGVTPSNKGPGISVNQNGASRSSTTCLKTRHRIAHIFLSYRWHFMFWPLTC